VDNLKAVAEQFSQQGRIVEVRDFGSGNINKTFLVTRDAGEERHFVLQRINTRVFNRPELVIQNMRVATEHISKRLLNAPPGRRWEVPRVMPAGDGRDYWIDRDGSFWRAMSFIDAQSFDMIKDAGHAEEVGHALGLFHSLLSDLPCSLLADTLEGFHITPLYLKHYDDVLAKLGNKMSPETDYCAEFVSSRRGLAHVLEDARAKGILELRPVHGDPKVNNIMVDRDTGQAVSIVDLDTVKPGLVHYDIGDCLRSGCNPLGEETAKWEDVEFDTEFCRAILKGYLSMAGEFLTGDDIEYIYDSIRLITFELGLRFFTDFLEGNIYFRVNRPGHNLARALVQFRLTESIESREAQIRNIIREIR
jgi:hypothetical protein